MGTSSETISNKIKKTNNDLYGSDYYLSTEDCKKQSKQTKLDKYGDENYNNRTKFKETCLKEYGFENPMQSPYISAKSKKKYKFNGLNFDSNWELIVYKKLLENNIDFEYHPNITFEYINELTQKHHFYQPDFLINDEYYEIKGPQFFDKVTGKMRNPYRKNLSKEELEEMDALYEAKYNCMIKNEVHIITDLSEVNYESKF